VRPLRVREHPLSLRCEFSLFSFGQLLLRHRPPSAAVRSVAAYERDFAVRLTLDGGRIVRVKVMPGGVLR
jgi:hypothetical protein